MSDEQLKQDEEPKPQSSGQKRAHAGLAGRVTRVAINLFAVIIPVLAYWFLVLERNQDYQVERGFRALGEIHRQAANRLEAAFGLFNIESAATAKQLAIPVKFIRWVPAPSGVCESEAQSAPGVLVDDSQSTIRLYPCHLGETVKQEKQSGETDGDGEVTKPATMFVLPVVLELAASELFAASEGMVEFERVLLGTEQRVVATLNRLENRPGEVRSPHPALFDNADVKGLKDLIRPTAGKSQAGDAGEQGKKRPTVSTIKDVQIGGRNYSAFVRPAQLGFDDKEDFYLVGLRSKADILEAATNPGNRILLFFLALLVLLIVSWPILRLTLREPRHPVSFYELWRVGGALAVIGAVIAVSAYVYSAQFRASSATLDASRQLAEQIASELRDGIADRRQILEDENIFDVESGSNPYQLCPCSKEECADLEECAEQKLCADLEECAEQKLCADIGECTEEQMCTELKQCAEKPRIWKYCDASDNARQPDGPGTSPGIGSRDGANVPLLEVLGTTDGKGNVLAPVITTTQCRPSPEGANISKRDYFRLLQGTNAPGLVAQRLMNWENGEKMLQLAVPRENGGIATGDTRFATVTAFAEPRGLTFVVFDNSTGTVLFHSDDRRSLIENFFVETNHNGALKGAIDAGAAQPFRAIYQGRAHQFHYQPLRSGNSANGNAVASLNWGIAVGFDIDEQWSVGLVAWSNVVGVILGFAVLIWSMGIISFQITESRLWMSRMIWPGANTRPLVLSLGSVFVLAAGLGWLYLDGWRSSTSAQFWATLLAVTLPALLWVLGKSVQRNEAQTDGDCTHCWPLLLLLLVTATGPIPALMLSPSSWQFHETVSRLEKASQALDDLRADRRSLQEALGNANVHAHTTNEIFRYGDWSTSACQKYPRGIAATIWEMVPVLKELVLRYRLDSKEQGRRVCGQTENSPTVGLFDLQTGYAARVALSAGFDAPRSGAYWIPGMIWTLSAIGFVLLCLSVTRLMMRYRTLVRNGPELSRSDRRRRRLLCFPSACAEFDLLHDVEVHRHCLPAPAGRPPTDRQTTVLWISGFDEVISETDPTERKAALDSLAQLLAMNFCTVVESWQTRDKIAAALMELAYEPTIRHWSAVGYAPAGQPDSASADELERFEIQYCHAAWATLLQQERLALVELARGSIPGPDHVEVLKVLARKELCTLSPFPRISLDRLRQFVLDKATMSESLELVRPRGPSVWQSLRIPLFIVLALGVGWLAYSGGETVQVMTAVLAATLGVATRLNQFTELFRLHE